MKTIKRTLLGLLGVSLALVALLSAGDHSPRLMTGGGRFIGEAVGALLVSMVAIQFSDWAIPRTSYMPGALAGAIGGAIQMVHMSLEAFGAHVGDRTDVTLGFMGVTLAIWLTAGIRAGVVAHAFKAAVVVAAWSAICSMIVAVTYGVLLAGCGYPDASYVATWPEYTGSGWSDARAFSIASSFEAVLSHLFDGPVLGVALGLIAGTVVAIHRTFSAGRAGS